ncbi:MAG: hypothetical protein JO153_07400 [Solirubrobacterales bacterium]|nr:hypothetical protein [Solirubrobacterales bacterium]
MSVSDLHLDANAVAATLQQIFVSEPTSAERVCQSCGQQRALGAHRMFRGAGIVLRCPACGDIAASVAVLPDRYVVRLRGTWSMTRAEAEASD